MKNSTFTAIKKTVNYHEKSISVSFAVSDYGYRFP